MLISVVCVTCDVCRVCVCVCVYVCVCVCVTRVTVCGWLTVCVLLVVTVTVCVTCVQGEVYSWGHAANGRLGVGGAERIGVPG